MMDRESLQRFAFWHLESFSSEMNFHRSYTIMMNCPAFQCMV